MDLDDPEHVLAKIPGFPVRLLASSTPGEPLEAIERLCWSAGLADAFTEIFRERVWASCHYDWRGTAHLSVVYPYRPAPYSRLTTEPIDPFATIREAASAENAALELIRVFQRSLVAAVSRADPDPDASTGIRPYGHPVEPPAEPWAYQLDTPHLEYGPGLWPFRDRRGDRAAIRATPDAAFKAWANMRVTITPSPDSLAHADARMILYIRRLESVAIVMDACATLDLARGTHTIDTPLTSALHRQAACYADKLLTLISVHHAARRAGINHPTTAYDLFATPKP